MLAGMLKSSSKPSSPAMSLSRGRTKTGGKTMISLNQKFPYWYEYKDFTSVVFAEFEVKCSLVVLVVLCRN